MQKPTMREVVENLAVEANRAVDAKDALQYSQASLNVANAMAVLRDCPSQDVNPTVVNG